MTCIVIHIYHFVDLPHPVGPRGLALRWCHNGHDSVSNHQPHDCLLNRLFRRRSKKTSKLRVTGVCGGNSPGTGEFPAQMVSYAENVSIWWRHHDQAIRHTCGDDRCWFKALFDPGGVVMMLTLYHRRKNMSSHRQNRLSPMTIKLAWWQLFDFQCLFVDITYVVMTYFIKWSECVLNGWPDFI